MRFGINVGAGNNSGTMSGFWSIARRALGLGLLAGVTVALGGCGVAQTEYDALKTENEDLRGRIASCDATNREKDTRIAELETRSQQAALTNTQQPIGNFAPTGGNVGGDDGPFRRNSDGNLTLEIAGEVLFDSGQAVIKTGAKKDLDRAAKSLNGKFSGKSVRIEGHTDSDPIKKAKAKYPTNEALSEARAQAVRTYLVSKGVSSGRVSAVGMGSSQPKGTKKDSRRVEVVVVGG